MRTRQKLYYLEQIGMTSLIFKTMTVLCNVKDRVLGNRVEARTFTQIMSDVLTPEQFKYLATEIERKTNV